MATERVNVLVDIAVKGRDQIKGATDDMARLGNSGGVLGRAAGGFKSIGMAAGAAGLAIGAAALAAKKAWNIMGEGAALLRTEARFNKLAASIGATANVLTAELRAATHGTISDMELMASASQLISLRLADNADQVVRLGAVAGVLNWDMQQVILTFANMSTMRLDALGLSVGEVTSKARELELQGMSSQEAFKEAVILAGEAQAALLDVGDDAVRSMEQAQTGWENAKNNFKMGLVGIADATGITRFVGDIGDALTKLSLSKEENQLKDASAAIATANKNIADGNLSYETYIGYLESAIASGYLFADTQKLVSSEIEKVNAAIEEQARAAALAAAGGRDITEVYREWAVATEVVGEQAQNFVKAFSEAVSGMTAANIDPGPLVTFGDALNSTAENAGAMTFSIDAANAALYKAAQAAGASAAELAILGVATGQFTEAEADAALKTAILQEAINRLASDYANGEISVREMTAALREQMAEIAAMPSLFNDITNAATQSSALIGDKFGSEPWYRPVNGLVKRDAEEIEKATRSVGGFTQQVDHLAEAHKRLASAFSEEVNAKPEDGLIDAAGVVNIENASKALFEQAQAAGATASQLAMLGVATGQFTEEEAKAALKAAILMEKIKMLAAGVASGDIGIGDAIGGLGSFKEQLDSGQIAEAAGGVEALGAAANALATNGPYTAELTAENSAAMQAINDVQIALNNLISGNYNIAVGVAGPDLTGSGRAIGGPVGRGRPYVVGEVGPELFVPNTGGSVVSNSQLRDVLSGVSGGSSYNVNITNYIDGVAQPRSTVDDVTTSKLLAALNSLGVR